MSDVLALLAIVVSVASAFATLYVQYFARRHVAVALGEEIYLGYGQTVGNGSYQSLDIILSLSLINGGACDALVTVVTATVMQPSTGLRIEARWRSFFEPTESGENRSSPSWKFNGWVRPLAATSRQVVTEWVYFHSSPIAKALSTGEYVLELDVTELRPAGTRWSKVSDEVDKRTLARWVGGFTIDEPSAGYLESKCVAVDGRTPDSVRVELRRR